MRFFLDHLKAEAKWLLGRDSGSDYFAWRALCIALLLAALAVVALA